MDENDMFLLQIMMHMPSDAIVRRLFLFKAEYCI